jgi:hypothetical protein
LETTTPIWLFMKIRIRALTSFQLSTHDIQNWLDLESRALENNIYLSPHFVIPAIRYLDPDKKVLLIFIERIDLENPKMMGLVTVTLNLGNKMAPGPYLDTYQSRHSFLGTPLIDKAHAPQVITQLLKYLSQRFRPFIGMVWNQINLDGELAQLLYDSLYKQRMECEVIKQFDRPILVPQYCTPELIKTELGKKYKEYARCMRRLAEQGKVDWIAYRETMPESVVDNFLRLEHAGWKGTITSSLLSNSAEENFFRKMAFGFASEGRALFTELRFNDIPIASTSNFVSGSEGFAFKIGWDSDYRKFGVGILNEIELIRHAQEVCRDLAYIDSGCSDPNSFISDLWLRRRQIGSLFFPFGKVGRSAWRLHCHVRSMVHFLRGKLRDK